MLHFRFHQFVIGLLLLILHPDLSGAATSAVTTTTDGLQEGTLRHAIGCANVTPGSDFITLPAGIYTLTIPGASEDLNSTGDLDVSDDLTIVGVTGNPEDVVIDASVVDLDGDGPGFGDRIFDILGGTINLSHLTIRGGNVNGSGGGINARTVRVNLNNVVIHDNHAEGREGMINDGFGGGVDMRSEGGQSSELHLSECIVANNSSDFGGGLNTDRVGVFIDRSQIRNNVSRVFAGGIACSDFDGAISNQMVLTHSVVMDNTSETDGGGIWFSAGELEISDTTIDGNRSKFSFGGGLVINVCERASISRSTFSNNTSPFGAGFFNIGSQVEANNCTFSGNHTDGEAGALFNSTELRLVNTTITGNAADLGGDGIVNSEGEGVSLIVHNTIVAGNGDQDIKGFLDPVSSSNFIGDGTGLTGISNGTNGNQIGTHSSPIDPLIGPLLDNGGLTQTHALLEGSPAIDAGNDSLAVDREGSTLSTDQRGEGFPRFLNGDESVSATVDIGAFELAPIESCPQPYPDFNDDQTVDAIDLLMLLGGIEAGDVTFDLTEDAVANEDDLLEFGLSRQRPDCAN